MSQLIKLSNDEIKLITHFEKTTGATVKDCISGEELTFIVKEGDLGMAIGKQGTIINKIKKEMKREIHIYEHSDDPEKFIKNLFYPVRIERVEINDAIATVYANPEDKKRAIGRAGKKINTVREIAKRHLEIEEIRVV